LVFPLSIQGVLSHHVNLAKKNTNAKTAKAFTWAVPSYAPVVA